MISTTVAFQLVNNLDLQEATRRYGPSWSVVFVDASLQAVAVKRFKEKPGLSELDEGRAEHEPCAYFYAQPGMYSTVEHLEAKVKSCGEAFRINWGNGGKVS